MIKDKKKCKKILEGIFIISLIIAFLGWLFLGFTEVYAAAVTVAAIIGLYYFFRYFPIRDFFKDDK